MNISSKEIGWAVVAIIGLGTILIGEIDSNLAVLSVGIIVYSGALVFLMKNNLDKRIDEINEKIDVLYNKNSKSR